MSLAPSSAQLEPHPYRARWWTLDGVLGATFATQADLKRRVREIIDPAELNTPLRGSDTAFLIDVLRRHQNWREKQGPGIKAILVRMNPPPGFGPARRGLWLIRTDGSEVDISWYAPFQRGGILYATRGVALAARREVTDQTRAVYALYRNTPCPICGRTLKRGHVDHLPPLTLARLLANWLADEQLTPADIEIVDTGTERTFVDRKLATRWAQYHRLHAKLRLIHPNENLAQAKSAGPLQS